jgi:hypothetical protein
VVLVLLVLVLLVLQGRVRTAPASSSTQCAQVWARKSGA